MDSRLFDLTRELTRARRLRDACRRGLDGFNRDADESNPRTARIRRKFEADLRLAEEDVSWAEIALADATSPAEVAGKQKERVLTQCDDP